MIWGYHYFWKFILSSNCAEFKWLSNIHSYDQRCIGRSRKIPPKPLQFHPLNHKSSKKFELRLCGSDDKRRGAHKKHEDGLKFEMAAPKNALD